MFAEDDLLPISALQHLIFCERQCALIHLEGAWEENRLTVEGHHLHRKAHDAPGETRAGIRIARGLRLRSLRLGLTGQADVVEFHAMPDSSGPRVVPIEYKRGRPKAHDADVIQLCAQALCLEEMLGTEIEAAALYYGQTRHRLDVAIDAELREHTERACTRLRELISLRITPAAIREPKCDQCSLINVCMPDALSPRRRASTFVERALRESLGDELATP